MKKRAVELETVAQVSAASATNLDLDSLLQSVVDLTKQSFDLYHAHVYLLDEAGKNLVLAAGAGEAGRIMKEQGRRIALSHEGSLVARAGRTRRGVIVNDVTQAPDFMPNPLLPDTRAEMAVPMAVSDRLIGVLDMQAEKTGRFGEADVRVMGTLADQVAVAVQNAHAFADVSRAEQAAQKRAEEMETVAQVSAASIAINDVEDLLQAVVDLTKQSFSLYHAHIYLLDQTGKNLVLAAGAEEVGRIMKQEGRRIALSHEGSLVARAGRTRRGVIVNDVTKAPDFMANPLLPDTRSELAVPLIVGPDLVGVLDVQSDQAGRFTEEDVQIQTVLGAQVAIAIQNAHAFKETRNAATLIRSIIDTSPDWIFAKDRNYRYLVVNEAFATWYGKRTPDQMVGLDDYDLGTPAFLIEGDPAQGIRGFRADDRQVLETGEMIANPYDVVNFADGTLHIFDTKKIPLRDAEGQVVGVLGLSRDVTDVYASQEEMKKRAVELETVAQVSAASATILNTDDLLQAVADLTKQSFDLYHAHVYLLDQTGENLVLAAGAGEPGRIMKQRGHAIPASAQRSLVARAAREREGVIANDVTEAPDFLPNPLLPQTISEMAVPMIVGGEVIGVMDMQSEKTGRFTEADVRVMGTLADQIAVAVQNARLYQTQVQVAEEARALDKLKSEFLASMSHELRTPLNSIIGYAEVMLDGIDGELPEPAIEDAQAIHDSGHHLLSMINDILDLAKIEAGRMELDLDKVRLADVAEEVYRMTHVLVKSKPVQIVMDIDPNLPSLQADQVRLRQILNNLVSNAIKFTEEGEIRVKAMRSTEDHHALIQVIDTGMGIAPDQLSRVFERFHQADSSSTRRAGGTGMGLTITRHLVHLHGGEIGAESTQGAGSTFWFTIPLVLEPAAAS
jgi:signal transduction histidine kinase/PAS domain-containing protein